jgi:hypothetical protein
LIYLLSQVFSDTKDTRRAWRYQRGNQNPYIEEEQTTQWPKEKLQKDKQRSTKHTYKTKDRVTRTPLNTGDEPRCSGRVSSSCSTSDTQESPSVQELVLNRKPITEAIGNNMLCFLVRIWLNANDDLNLCFIMDAKWFQQILHNIFADCSYGK